MSKKSLKEDYPFLKAVIDRFENDKFILKFDDGQSLILPVNLLRKKYKEGDSLIFILNKDENITVARENLAKDLLDFLISKK